MPADQHESGRLRAAERPFPARAAMTADAASSVVVLGSCGGWPEPGRACSGFVVEHNGFRVVLDLGYGTLSRLLTHLGNEAANGLDAVFVSHSHPDHSIDLHGLFRARSMGAGVDPPAVPLYAPESVVHQVESLEADGGEDVRTIFDWHPLPADDPYELGPFRMSSWALPHYVPNAGVRLEALGLIVAYTGDSGPDPALVDLARDADLFIAEASEARKSPGAKGANYLAADEAAGIAESAGAQRLLLSHLWPGSDRAEPARVARAIFSGEVLVADEGLVVQLR